MDIYTNIGVVLLNRMLSEGSVGGIGRLSLTPIDTLHQLVRKPPPQQYDAAKTVRRTHHTIYDTKIVRRTPNVALHIWISSIRKSSQL